jgi:HD-GYP domain-containing protein (c-di-GMP phosphodiesterase class II)
VETQTPLPLSVGTRDHAREVLARAFEEAAVMPGTLLPHELLIELTSVAHEIVHDVTNAPEGAFGFGFDFKDERAGPAAYNIEHAIDTTVIGLLVGRRLVPGDVLGDLGLGLFLQDIGKLALPPRLVHKEGPLAADEWELMMRHPLLGLEFLRDDTIPPRAKSVIRSHHERWDGSGYPGALVGQEISEFARIAAVADVFDALTSERYHAPAVSRHQGLATVLAGSGTAFDPKVVETFLVVAGV